MFNSTKFRWYNSLTGDKFYCTMNELRQLFKLDASNLGQVANGNRKRHKGWQIENNR